jgi:hypothetical protein
MMFLYLGFAFKTFALGPCLTADRVGVKCLTSDRV